MGWFIPLFTSQSLILFGFGYIPIFFLCGFKKRPRLSLVRTPSVLQKKKGEAENECTSQLVREGLVGLS